MTQPPASLPPLVAELTRSLTEDPSVGSLALALADTIDSVPLDAFRPAPAAWGPDAVLIAVRMARRGAIDDFLEYLIELQSDTPDLPVLAMALPFAEALADLDAVPAVQALTRLVQPGGPAADGPAVERIRDTLDQVLDALAAAKPDAVEPRGFQLACAMNWQRLDRADELSRTLISEHPGANACEARMAVCELRDDAAGMLDAAREALRHDPDRPDLGRRIAEALVIAGDADGLAAFVESTRDSGHESWHPAATLAAGVLADPTAATVAALHEALVDAPHDENLSAFVVAIARWRGPWIGYLPALEDPTILVLQKVREHLRQKPDDIAGLQLQIRLPGVEAPSAGLAWAMEAARIGANLPMVVEVERIAEPDPRRAVEPMRIRLWEFPEESISATAVFPEPHELVAGMIGTLATTAYDADVWWHGAAEIAYVLHPDRLLDVLACMTSPPLSPVEQIPVEDHVLRTQIAAALVIAAFAHESEPWPTSRRRVILRSLFLGPMDWTVNAAAVALRGVALHDPSARADIQALFRTRRETAPDSGYCCYATTLDALTAPGQPFAS